MTTKMSKSLKKSHKYVSVNEINQSSQGPNIQETQLYDRVTRVEQQIHSKLFEAKKYRTYYNCQHTHIQISKNVQEKIFKLQDKNQRNKMLSEQANNIIGKYNDQINYYDKFWKLFLLNEMTKKKIDDLKQSIVKINEIQYDVSRYFNDRQNLFKNNYLKGLKRQKQKSFISDQFSNSIIAEKQNICPYPECQKHYNSQASLNLHMKSKHNAGKKSQRQQQAEIYWKYIDQKKQTPHFQIQFPPGYLEQYAWLTGRIDRKTYQDQKILYGWRQGQIDKRKYQFKRQQQQSIFNFTLKNINNQ